MSYFSGNVKALRKQYGFDQATLAAKLGKRGGTSVANWEKGTAVPPVGVLSDMAHLFHVKIDDLMERDLSKKGSIVDQINDTVVKLHPARQQNVYTYAEDQLNEQQNENVVQFSEQREIVCGRGTAAGAPIDGDTQDAEVRRTRVNVDDIPASADEIVTVEGDSMEPDYPKYSQIFVRWQDTIDDGDLAVVRVADEGVTFKQVSRDYQQKKIVLHSLNDKYPDRYLDPEDISIIGVVLN